MNDLAIRFLQPSNPNHRRYEALRALLVDQLPLPEAAQRFGYSPGSLRNLLSDFRRHPERLLNSAVFRRQIFGLFRQQEGAVSRIICDV